MLNLLKVRTVIKTTYSSFLKDKTINSAFYLKIALWFDINNRPYKNKQERLTKSGRQCKTNASQEKEE